MFFAYVTCAVCVPALIACGALLAFWCETFALWGKTSPLELFMVSVHALAMISLCLAVGRAGALLFPHGEYLELAGALLFFETLAYGRRHYERARAPAVAKP